MCKDYCRRVPFAVWDPEQIIWTLPDQPDIFGRLGVYSEIWPNSGMVLDGRAFQLPELERLTKESEFSELPGEDQLFLTPLVESPSRLSKERLYRKDFRSMIAQILELATAEQAELINDLFGSGEFMRGE